MLQTLCKVHISSLHTVLAPLRGLTSTHLLLLNLALNWGACVVSTHCVFMQRLQNCQVFWNGFRKWLLSMHSMWHPYLIFSSTTFQVRLGAELSKDNSEIHSCKIILCFILLHIELQSGWECLLWPPKGKGKRNTKIRGSFLWTTWKLSTFWCWFIVTSKKNIWKPLTGITKLSFFCFMRFPQLPFFPHTLVPNWFCKYNLTFNGCNFCYWQILKYFVNSS